MKQFSIGLLVSFTTLLFCLLLGELGVRIFYQMTEGTPSSLEDQLKSSSAQDHSKLTNTTSLRGLVQASSNPDIVYTLKNNIHGLFLNKPYRINSFGVRGSDYTLEKPTNTKRIVGIGDSIMFGFGVAQEDVYSHQLELRYADIGRKIEFINFAVPGYNSTMEVATLATKAIHFDPDAIVLHFVKNDLEVPYFMRQPKDLYSLKKSFLLDFILERLNSNYTSESKSLHSAGLKSLENVEKWDVLERYRHMAGEKSFIVAMEKLHKIAIERKIPVIVITGSVPKKLTKLLEHEANRHNFKLVYVKPYVDVLLEKNGVENTTEARKKALWVSDVDSHPNALGHQAYTNAVFDALENIDF